MNQTMILDGIKGLPKHGLGAPLMMLAVFGTMLLPLPAFVLDLFFTFNIALSLIIMMAVIYTNRPLDFGVFPTVLLVATLLRLSLNIASARVVLLHGHGGADAAGKVIQAFGEFVIGGNYAVGFVVFAILTIINFVVVTKGAGRISEVSARFTLDAMPGKQMAIDADLNAGLINQEEAKARRSEVAREADFYGAMDGAGKFVRGDAVAGMLILAINLFGGLAIGVLQQGMPLAEAAQVFTLLTIGDGLVAQIPALLLSTAAAMMVTRTSTEQDMGQQILAQLFNNPKTLGVTAGVIGLMGVIPGMPNVAFLGLASIAGGSAYYMARRHRKAEIATEAAPVPAPVQPKELSWDDVQAVDMVGLEVGFRLIPMVDKNQGGQLLGRLKGVRKKLSQELGFLIPAVHIRDNLDLPPSAYRITLLGATVSQDEVFVDKELAINPGQVFGDVKGTATIDPVFRLEAVWIEPFHRDEAQSLGYTVVDASTVVATHVSKVLQDHANALLGHDEVQQLLDRLAKSNPKLVEDLVPKMLPLIVVVKVLQNLLRENVPIRDMRTIVEVLSEQASRSQDPVRLTAAVRIALGRLIVEQINGLETELAVITLDHTLERILLQSIQVMSESGVALEPGLANQMVKTLQETVKRQETAGRPAVLLTPDPLREFLARFLRQNIANLHVLAYSEIPENKQVRIVASVGGASA